MKKISFIFKAWKKPKLQKEEDTRLVNQKSNFIISKMKSNEKTTVLKKLMGDQNYQKRGEIGLKFKNQDLTLRNSLTADEILRRFEDISIFLGIAIAV